MSSERLRQATRALLYLLVTGTVVYLIGGLAYDFGGWRAFGRFLGLWVLGWGGLVFLCLAGGRAAELVSRIDRTLGEYPAWSYLRWPVWGGLFCLGAGTVYALLSQRTVWEASTEIGVAVLALPITLVVASVFWGALGLVFVFIERV